MLRGVSLAPRNRAVDPQDLPSELKSSLLGVPLYNVSPYYGSTDGSGARPFLASPPLDLKGRSHTRPHCSEASSSPSYMSRLLGKAKSRFRTGVSGLVPVFDYDGQLTTYQVGVNTFRFRSLSFFYFLRSQPWKVLITYSIALYIAIVVLIAAAYYTWGVTCGAGMSVVSAIYFTVVSLAANGGYMGEDEGTMTDPNHICYRGRTFIVMVCSYVNIVFVGLVAALIVGKAEYTGKLGHRIVFSDFCTLTKIPGRLDRWRLVFRVAHADNQTPLAHGKLRLFCVAAEPIKDYRTRQQQRQLYRHSRLLKGVAVSTEGSTRSLSQKTEPPEGGPRQHVQRVEVPAVTVNEEQHAQSAKNQRGRGHRGIERSTRPSNRHQQQQRRRRKTQATRLQRCDTDTGDERGEASAFSVSEDHQNASGSSSRSSSNSNASTQSATATSSSSSSASSNKTAAFSSHKGPRESCSKTAESPKGQGRAVVDSVVLDQTDSAVSSQEHNHSHAAHAGGPKETSEAGATPPEKPLLCPARTSEPPLSIPVGSHPLGKDTGGTLERVHISLMEMRWTCAEESYLDHGDGGALSLWYPVSIVHVVDERSPLYPFLDQPHVAASLGSGSSYAEVPSTGCTPAADVSRHRFQLVAVFDATEMETGTTITAKHTYTTDDIVAHYKFSDRLVHMHQGSSEVILDFHYFNALMPVDLSEPSTTDSDE